MTDKIQKFFAKLSKKELDLIHGIISKIAEDDTGGLQVKKLEGYTNIFRVKRGDFRIIFIKEGSNSNIISVNRRSEKTYKDF
jgi:mRNA-degrading endonuclease RelE of RelBE toxin-antitoxin system